ncbi:MAG TPA: SDR family NAD(P)-dependent oxidoreductase, partial [Candidatus Limnocylindria bacterium]|nr:SDR family NAD(P)-dependent oxidoreductase [Candidatus Limnocylindria bacterium]
MAGRVVWVSGASSGLGRAAALALKAAGWRVVSGARSFAAEAETDLGRTLPLDVTDQASVDAFRDRASALYGAPDALVCAAGILTLSPAEEVPFGEMQGVLDTVLFGSIRMARAAMPLMRERGGGKIVMLSSVNGLLATPYQGAYVAAKHALEGFSECLMLEARAQNIQVTIAEPGDHQGGQAKYRGKASSVQPLYADSFRRVTGVIARDEAGGGDPAAFGRSLARLLDRRRMPVRKRFTKAQEFFAIVAHDVLPGRFYSR